MGILEVGVYKNQCPFLCDGHDIVHLRPFREKWPIANLNFIHIDVRAVRYNRNRKACRTQGGDDCDRFYCAACDSEKEEQAYQHGTNTNGDGISCYNTGGAYPRTHTVWHGVSYCWMVTIGCVPARTASASSAVNCSVLAE